MRLLLPTGSITRDTVTQAARGMDAEVVITGEIASFLTPGQLRSLLSGGTYDMAIVSGMCTASFADVEQDTGVPIFKGPRHAADLPLILPRLGEITLSRTVPADDYLAAERKKAALTRVRREEEEASCDFSIRGVKIGGTSRMKVLAEIMDAHRHPDIAAAVERFFASGADIVDLGFGFDATPGDVRQCFAALREFPGPLAVDSQDPELIRAALFRADLVLSLQEENIPLVAAEVARAGAAAVIVPGGRDLAANLRAAEAGGINRIIADPLLQPVGSGLVASLRAFAPEGHPLFFGAGNVVELLDADSPGANALLAGMARECGAAVIFTSEHSDKTLGSVGEMRTATEMMVLVRDRPYPKDLGIDLLVMKEKRRRREPPLSYTEVIDAIPMPDDITYDPRGNLRIGIEDGMIVAVHNGIAFRGERWQDVLWTLLAHDRVSLLDHAAYLGKELFKAECALRFGRSFEQDGPF
ncbi:MAG: dihydropteroate synthase-like protein [Methanomicrobiaceae archaeon]|nr:dihydropteroate synthase-like protein [Methanomicrobiaceae archaeon]